MKENMEDLIKKMKTIDGIPTPDALRELANKYHTDEKENFFHFLFERHKECIENYMLQEANKGNYYCWSEPLSTTFKYYDVEYPTEERRAYLQKKIYTVFGDALGFKVRYITADDVMEISWEK